MISTKKYVNNHPNAKLQPLKPIPVKESHKKPNRFFVVLDKNKKVIGKVCLLTGAILLGAECLAYADSSLDERANELYFNKFIGIVKWIIVVKGGWDTVNRMLQEDFDGAKKCFFQYLIIFGILLGLPTALTEAEKIFREFS